MLHYTKDRTCNDAKLLRDSQSRELVSAPCVNRRVLVVDDEENVLSSIRRVLRREPYELVTARNATDALDTLDGHSVQVVVSDYRMPGMTGTELLSQVQQRFPDTIRIVLSGYSEVTAIIDAINRGAIYKFISKPWNDEELRLHIRRAMEQYELKMENSRMAREIALQNDHLQELNLLLDQQASDARTGQCISQRVLEATAAGVIAVDVNGLVVFANGRAHELLANPTGGLIGLTVDLILDGVIAKITSHSSIASGPRHTGTISHTGRHLSYSCCPLFDNNRHAGDVVTLWGEDHKEDFGSRI